MSFTFRRNKSKCCSSSDMGTVIRNSTVSMADPSWHSVATFFTSGSVRSASSIGTATSSSTSWASAPGHGTTTIACLTATTGSSSFGICT